MKKIKEISELKNKSINIVAKFIHYLIHNLNKMYINLTQDSEIENKYNFEDLMPKIDIEKNKQYCESIDWAIRNKKIRNIALTGVYGAGKSTILNTYIKEHNEYNYLNISLSNFKELEGEDILSNESINIEKAILKQMFYKEKNTTIPYSRFRRITNINYISLIAYSILSLVVVVFIVLSIKPDLLEVVKSRIELIKGYFNISSSMVTIMLLIFISSFVTIINKMIIFIKKNIRVKKVSAKSEIVSSELEIGEKDESAFNKYVDEILYYFESTKYDIVVFEDLDRFNNIDIFTKLRELNSLINESKQINRRIVFIYALKDDMFCNEKHLDDKTSYKSRTKFFDFIIPVVQVANSSNACDILIKKFKDAKQFKGLTEKFISEITILINDMRVLNNIYNEFVIYKENLKDKEKNKLENKESNMDNDIYELDYEKLLAIIVYKNVYPVDFARLQDNEGMVYDVFSNKKNIAIKKRMLQINNKIQEIKKDIEVAEHECANNLRELRTIYLSEIKDLSTLSYINCNGEQFDLKRLTNEEEFFNNCFYSRSNHKYYNGKEWISFKLDNIHILNNGLTYAEREKIIKLKEKNISVNIIEDLKTQLEKLNEEKIILKSLPFNELIKECEDEELFDGDIKNEDLLKFLIKRNYIDENYYEYISYFYEGTLTKQDKSFLINIMYEKDVDYDYAIQKPEMLLQKMEEYQFTKRYSLNYSLMDYLIKHNNFNRMYMEYYNLLIKQLSNEDENNMNFIDTYLDRNKDNELIKEQFMKALCKEWKNMWTYLQLKSNFKKGKLDMYLTYIIKYNNVDDIIGMNINGILTEYISHLPNFLNLIFKEVDDEKVELIIKKLNVVFVKMDKVNKINKILDYINENNLYEINLDMIALILQHYSEKDIFREIYHSNYTTIKESRNECLISYIDKNINEYLVRVFFRLLKNTNEKEEYIIELLNNEEVNSNNKIRIIKEIKFVVSDVSRINSKELCSEIIKNYKITVYWKNIINYFIRNNQQIDDIIINYLNKEDSYVLLGEEKLDTLSDVDEKIISDFSKKLILCDSIKEDAFNKLIKSITNQYYSFEGLKNLSENKVNMLIDDKIIGLSLQNYILLKENFKNKHIKLLVNNIDFYISEYEKYALEVDEIEQLLLAKIGERNKIFIIEHINTKNIIENENLINAIIHYTLKYDITLNIQVLESCLESNLNTETKVILLNTQINNLDKNITFKLLNIIGGKYSEITRYGSSPILENTNTNKELIRLLDEKNYISSKNETSKGIRVNTYKKER